MSFSRIMGQNICQLACEKYGSVEEISKALDISVTDVGRIIDGRVILPPDELQRIAQKLDTDIAQLTAVEDKDYSYMECMTDFKSDEKKALLLNIIDSYVSLEEQYINR